MTFLAPFAGLLAGSLGLGALLVLHALKLRRRPLRVSSTLLWRDAARDLEVNVPFRAPRPTPMFLLQALAVLLLAGAIARPVAGSADRIPGRLIVVIDASASMNARDADAAGATRLDRAKALAAERLESLRRGAGLPEIAVVRAALEPRMVVAPTRSLDAALAGVRSVTPTDQPLDAAALRTMLAALRDRAGEEDADRADEPTLWVFTDAGDLTPETFAGWSGRIVPAAETPGENAGIAALIATRDPADPATARVFMRLVSNARRPVGVVVRISGGQGPATVTPIEIPTAEDDRPGSVTRTVSIAAPGPARVEASIERGGGVLEADDRAWADLPDPAPPRTVVFAPDARPSSFLLDVLGVLAPGAVSVHGPNELDALAGADLAVYDRVTPRALPRVPSLGFASAWPPGPLPDPEAEPDPARRRVVAWDRAHPVLREVSLATLAFERAVPLPDASTPGVAVLAEAADGPAIIEGVGAGVRHVRTAFAINRSNWSVDVALPIFVAACFERLVPGVRGEGLVHTTAQPVEVRAAADRVRAAGPAEAAAPAADGSAVLGPLPRAGVYSLAGAANPTLAVSMLDAGESAIPVGPPGAFGREAAPGAAADALGRRELWPTLLLAAFTVMTLEWLAHALRARV